MKCFYHNDIDGRAAGAVVARYTSNYNRDDFFEVDYIQPLPIDKISQDEEVYLVDYSFKESTLDQLTKILDITKNVIWCDHHTSSMNLLETYPCLNEIAGLRIEGISGAALIHMYLYNCSFDDMPMYLQYVSDYDCWKYEFDPETTHFKIGLETHSYDAIDPIWNMLASDIEVEEQIIAIGAIIKGYIDAEHTQYRNSYSYETEIRGHKCLVVNRRCNSWIFGEKYNEYPLVMVWVFNGTKYQYSIYSSNKDIDCSKIAESYGGGGHKGAAGFSADELLFKKI
jgi:oligoribonuclease NrnB/cAMP/cGMP phosphodiesterase (DHH superfamily)